MYSVQNQFFQQVSQLTAGVAATVANTRVRSSTPRTGQQRLQVNPKFSREKKNPEIPASATSADGNDVVGWASQAKTALGPILASHLSKVTPSESNVDCPLPKGKEEEFQKVVSEFASKIIDNAAASVTVTENDDVSPAMLDRLWKDVLEAVNLPATAVGVGWSEKYLRTWSKSISKNVQPIQHCEEERFASNPSTFSSKYSLLSRSFSLSAFKSSGSFALDRRLSPLIVDTSSRLELGLSSVRTFKTRRDVEAAMERNPSLLARVKEKFFPSKADSTTAAGVSPTVANSDKLKAMIAELPPGEADKMKIAFAEGYMSGNSGGAAGGSAEKGRTYRWLRTLQQVLAIAVFTAILASLMGSFGGGMFRVSVGNGNEVQPEDINVTFADVKGVDEAKSELQDIVEFLKNPSRFVALGGKLPKGVLLVGPPGTGKTLLARAVAGEAGVPFFHAAGPEFDEILVGQGARRVRDLFKAAKLKAPCVVFIDEIDSVGAKRTNSVLHPYANQTINQLLSEMDGFRQNEGVIVLGATNRREDLDKALLRPGRFDVEVPVPAPEYQGRKDILEYYLSRVKAGVDVDVELLARGTTGFTGADLENMINQAALKAAIDGAESVGKKHLDFARDKVIMGPQRKTRIPDEEVNKITAYHEAGHALASFYTKDANPIHKVTIIPRGSSLGHTAYIPDKEQYHVTKSQLLALMDTMMGGRAAEELIFGIEKVTSGASSDLKQATAIATHMVKEWGMSEKVGLRTIEDQSKSLVAVNDLGPQTNELIDSEINRLLNQSYERAKAILKLHAKEHKALAEALMKYETLDAEDVKAILEGRPPAIPPKSPKTPVLAPPKAIPPPVVTPPAKRRGVGSCCR